VVTVPEAKPISLHDLEDRRPHLHPVATSQQMAGHALAVHERAVAAPAVLQPDALGRDREPGVEPGGLGIGQDQGVARGAADGGRAGTHRD